MVYSPGLGFVITFSLCSHVAVVALLDGRPHANVMPIQKVPRVLVQSVPVISKNGTTLPPLDTTYYFDQLIDHNNRTLGTFRQRYWHSWQFYETGGPIILMTPGEVNAEGQEGYLTDKTISGLIARQQNGTAIVLEHRFFGLSNPRPDLSVRSLQLHTLEQAVQDLAHFARNVKLPMPGGDRVQPGRAPWILIGGSYSGALTAWTMVNNPGVFFAGYASSAPVQAMVDFWGYFETIRLNMPQNCSADVQAVISHVDEVLSGNDAAAIQSLKDNFGLGNVKHVDDVAGSLRNILWEWQELQPTSGSGGAFYEFCDALEVKDGVSADIYGWGLDHSLAAWGNYYKNVYIASVCEGWDPETCLGTYSASETYWSDTTLGNNWRSWFWIKCNQLGYYQEGAPPGYPSIVSRLVQAPYELRQCSQMFPSAFPEPYTVQTAEQKIAETNFAYHGWDVKVPYLFFANGVRDPWREATVSAVNHSIEDTSLHPVELSNGFHCSDMVVVTAEVDPTIAAVQTKALKLMGDWLTTWRSTYGHSEAAGSTTEATPTQTTTPPAIPTQAINRSQRISNLLVCSPRTWITIGLLSILCTEVEHLL